MSSVCEESNCKESVMCHNSKYCQTHYPDDPEDACLLCCGPGGIRSTSCSEECSALTHRDCLIKCVRSTLKDECPWCTAKIALTVEETESLPRNVGVHDEGVPEPPSILLLLRNAFAAAGPALSGIQDVVHQDQGEPDHEDESVGPTVDESKSVGDSLLPAAPDSILTSSYNGFMTPDEKRSFYIMSEQVRDKQSQISDALILLCTARDSHNCSHLISYLTDNFKMLSNELEMIIIRQNLILTTMETVRSRMRENPVVLSAEPAVSTSIVLHDAGRATSPQDSSSGNESVLTSSTELYGLYSNDPLDEITSYESVN